LLVVDDDKYVLEAILDCLVDAGFDVTPAVTGEDAIAKACVAVPDVLITDLDLGAGMSGIELGVEARRRWPNLPLVYMSGRPWIMNQRVMEDRETFLPKPFLQRALVAGVHAVAVRVC
jgi:DNA-binding response OmpR family regulator